MLDWLLALSPMLPVIVPLFFWTNCPCCGCTGICSDMAEREWQVDIGDFRNTIGACGVSFEGTWIFTSDDFVNSNNKCCVWTRLVDTQDGLGEDEDGNFITVADANKMYIHVAFSDIEEGEFLDVILEQQTREDPVQNVNGNHILMWYTKEGNIDCDDTNTLSYRPDSDFGFIPRDEMESDTIDSKGGKTCRPREPTADPNVFPRGFTFGEVRAVAMVGPVHPDRVSEKQYNICTLPVPFKENDFDFPEEVTVSPVLTS